MTNSIQHAGVLGMHWGRRKAETPTSASHDKAMVNRNPFKVGLKSYNISRRRLNLEKTLTKMQKKGYVSDKTKAKTMSDKDIKEILKSPVMKKKLKYLNAEEQQRSQQAVGAMFALGIGAYYLSPVLKLGAKYALTKAVDAKRAGQVVKVASDVIDATWK